MIRFELYRSVNNEYRWKLLARNGKILADSGEGYKRRHEAVKAISKVKDAVLVATISETLDQPQAANTAVEFASFAVDVASELNNLDNDGDSLQ